MYKEYKQKKIIYFITLLLVLIFSSNLEARRRGRRGRRRYKKIKRIKKVKKVEKIGIEDTKKELIHKPVTKGNSNIPIEISVKYDKKKDDDIDTFIFLHYATFMAQDWQTKQMKLKGNSYIATIPGDYALKGGVVYYIEVANEFEEILTRFKDSEMPQYIDIKAISKKKIEKETKKIKKKKITKKIIEKEKLLFEEEFALFNQDALEVTTASKKSQKSTDAPAIITVISSQMIEKLGAVRLLDILKYIPAITTKLEGNGKFRISIRGTQKDGNILLMINGSRINNLYDSNALYDLPANFIKQVEIIRGPGSSLFGTDAVAGIINIITHDNINNMVYSMGINDNYSLGLNYSQKKDNMKFSILGGVLNDNGSKESLEKDLSSNEKWSLTNDPNKPFIAQRKSNTLYLSTTFKKDNFTIELLGFRREFNDWIGPNYIATTDSKYINLRGKLGISYNFDLGNISIIPKIYTDILDNDNLIQEKPNGFISSESHNIFPEGMLTKERYRIYSLGSEIQLNGEFNHFSFITGTTFEYFKIAKYDLKRNYKLAGEEYHEKFEIYDNDTLLEQQGKDRTVIALYLQADYKFKNLAITAGVRGDYYTDISKGAINPKFGIVYRFGKDTIIKGLYGEAFRAPTFKELYDQTNQTNQGIVGNKKLNSEKVKTAEFALESKISFLKLKGNVFYNISDNIISTYTRDGGNGTGIYENIGSTKNYGFEAEMITEFKHINFFTNISWFTKSFKWKEKEGFPIIKTDRESLLTDIPMRRINMGVNVKYDKIDLFIGIINASHSMNNNRLFVENISTVYIPSYWSIDLNISYKLYKDLNFSLIAKDMGFTHYTAPDNSDNIDNFGEKGMIQPGFFWMTKLIYNY